MDVTEARTRDEAKELWRSLLQYIGEDPDREGLQETPGRIIKSWDHFFGGYNMNAEEILNVQFAEHGDYDEVVAIRNAKFYSYCEHHFVPIIGEAHIGYIPGKKVVGVSKLIRLLNMYARRLQIQERMTSDIAADLVKYLEPLGVAVVIKAQHMCISSRGVENQTSEMVTSKMTGVFRTRPEARAEFLRLCGM